jgi:hypothetical protein
MLNLLGRYTGKCDPVSAVLILGRAYAAVINFDAATEEDMQANHAAEGTLRRLFEEAYMKNIGGPK